MTTHTFGRGPARLLAHLRAALRGDQQDFTDGSIDRAIFMLSVPMIVEMAMESLFAIVDIFFISQLGDNHALAVVVLTESMLTLVYSLGMGLAVGASAVVARRIGEKDHDAAGLAGAQAIYLALAVAALIAIPGLIWAGDLLRLMGAAPEIPAEHASYTRWMLGGNFTIVLLFVINGVFRGAGDATIAMRALVLSNGVNLVLDPLLIFGAGPIEPMGLTGAAVATNTGRAIGILYQIYCLSRGLGVTRMRASSFRFDPAVIANVARVAMGAVTQFLISSASWIFLVRIISPFGSAALAGYSIAMRVIMFAILPAWGMANAAATLVGQNLGAGKPERAEKSVWRAGFFNMVFLLGVSALFLFFAGPIIRLFTSDPETLSNGVRCLQLVSLGYGLYAYGMVVNQSFNGAGDTGTPTVLHIFGFWLFQIPVAYFLAKTQQFGPDGVYIAILAAEAVMAVAGIMLFRRGRWKTVKV